MEEFPLEKYMEERLKKRWQELCTRTTHIIKNEAPVLQYTTNTFNHTRNNSQTKIPKLTKKPRAKSTFKVKGNNKALTQCKVSKRNLNHSQNKENSIKELKTVLNSVNKKLKLLNTRFKKNKYK